MAVKGTMTVGPARTGGPGPHQFGGSFPEGVGHAGFPVEEPPAVLKEAAKAVEPEPAAEAKPKRARRAKP